VAPAESNLLEEIKAAPTGKRLGIVMSRVRAYVADVLFIPDAEQIDPHRGFFELGMDSLTSVELRSRLQSLLGCSLPTTLAFDHPPVEPLSKYLLGVACPAAPERSAETPAPRVPLDHLADDELARRLSDRLASVRRGRS